MAIGDWVWGHDTAVTEDFVGDIVDGAGTAEVVGTGDDETVCIETGEYWIFPAVNTGAITVEFLYDQYNTGSGSGTIEYRTGATRVLCEAAEWNTYSVPFASSGWVQAKLSK